jgi:hypothetical protein
MGEGSAAVTSPSFFPILSKLRYRLFAPLVLFFFFSAALFYLSTSLSGGRPSPPLNDVHVGCTVAWDAPLAGGAVRGFAMEAAGLLSALVLSLRQQHTWLARLVFVSTYVDESFVSQEVPAPIAQRVMALRGMAPADVYVSQWTPPGFGERFDSYRARLPREATERKIYTIARLMYETTAVPEGWYRGGVGRSLS